MMAGVVRRDGLREAVTALIEPGVEPDGEPLSEWVHVSEIRRVLDAVPDVPPDPPTADRPSKHRVYHWIKTGQLGFSEFETWLAEDAADVRARAQEAAWDEGWSAARQVVREQKPGDNPYRSDRAVSEREGAS